MTNDTFTPRTIATFRESLPAFIDTAIGDDNIYVVWDSVDVHGFIKDTDTYVTLGVGDIDRYASDRKVLQGETDTIHDHCSAVATLNIYGADDLIVQDIALRIIQFMKTSEYDIQSHAHNISVNNAGIVGVYHKPSLSSAGTSYVSYCVVKFNVLFELSYADNIGYIDTVELTGDIESDDDHHDYIHEVIDITSRKTK